jgi:hypothetical protein
MKIALFGIAEIKPGKRNLKDPRLDQAHELVEAQKKVNAQVDVLGEEELPEADAILVTPESKADLILKDLEFVETRLGREPQPAERAALEKIKSALENERFVFNSGLEPQEFQAVAAHSFFTNKPMIIAVPGELHDADALLLRAFREAGYICFLTVGGKENRAWPIRRRGKRRARFIPTSRRGSSAPKSSRSTILWRLAEKPWRNARAGCVWN